MGWREICLVYNYFLYICHRNVIYLIMSKEEIKKALNDTKDKVKSKDIKEAIDKKLKYINKPIVK